MFKGLVLSSLKVNLKRSLLIKDMLRSVCRRENDFDFIIFSLNPFLKLFKLYFFVLVSVRSVIKSFIINDLFFWYTKTSYFLP